MSSTTTIETISKPNIGVFTNPDHKLWVEETGPKTDDLKAKKGEDLPEGWVTVAIKSTGICGQVPLPTTLRPVPSANFSHQI